MSTEIPSTIEMKDAEEKVFSDRKSVPNFVNFKVSEKRLNGHTGLVSIIETDGHHIASAGEDCNICVWETTTGKQLQVLSGHTETVTGVGFLPSGRFGVEQVPEIMLVSSSKDGTIRLWLLRGGKELKTFALDYVITGLKVLLTDRIIITTDGGKIVARRPNDCELLDSVLAHANAAVTLTVEERSGYICSMGDNNPYFKVWSLVNDRFKELYNFNLPALESAIDVEKFRCIAMSRGTVYAADDRATYIIDWKRTGKISKIVGDDKQTTGGDAIFASEDLLMSSAFSSSESTSYIHVRHLPSLRHVCRLKCDLDLVLAIKSLKTDELTKFILAGSGLIVMDFTPPTEVEQKEPQKETDKKEDSTVRSRRLPWKTSSREGD